MSNFLERFRKNRRTERPESLVEKAPYFFGLLAMAALLLYLGDTAYPLVSTVRTDGEAARGRLSLMLSGPLPADARDFHHSEQCGGLHSPRWNCGGAHARFTASADEVSDWLKKGAACWRDGDLSDHDGRTDPPDETSIDAPRKSAMWWKPEAALAYSTGRCTTADGASFSLLLDKSAASGWIAYIHAAAS